MTRFNYYRLGALLVIMLAVIAVQGCSMATYYDSPRKESLQSMDFSSAKKIVKETCINTAIMSNYQESNFFGMSGNGLGGVSAIIITRNQLDLVTGNKAYRFPLKELTPKLQDTFYTGTPDSYAMTLDGKKTILLDRNAGLDPARKLLDALFFLKKTAQSAPPPLTDTQFQQIAQTYRNSKTKPAASSDVQKFSIQAEDAIRDKQNSEAAELYVKALDIAPWWPQGHFNLALVLSKIGDYEWASQEMKRYLLLVPDAPNAHAAQLELYDWQRKASE